MVDNIKSDITIHKLNESTLSIECNNTIAVELGRYFSAMAPNYRWMKAYKSGHWDGVLRFFNLMNHQISIGLLEEIFVFAKNRYTISTKITKPPEVAVDTFTKFVESLNLPMSPRDYQFQAALDAINKRRINIKSVTSSGKSLILYLIIRWMEAKNQKVILVVPSTLLVEQMFSDFEEYGWEYVADKCHMIYSGQKKVYDCPVIITTFQSQIKNMELLECFDCLLLDEAHLAKAKSLSDISKACVNAKWRIGCSGTYPDYKTSDWFGIVGSLGPIKEYNNYKQLQDEGYIAELTTIVLILEHDMDTKLKNYLEADGDYNAELDIAHASKNRNIFIKKMVKKFDKNCLVLYTKKEKHGDFIKEILQDIGKKIYTIDGDVDAKEREKIRNAIENEDNCVLLATYGTMSTGVSIKNLHHVVFASGYKSRVKILQSIGRGLRKHHLKTKVILYDLTDDLSLRTKEIKYINHSMKHLKERIKIYDAEKFVYKTIKIKLEDINE